MNKGRLRRLAALLIKDACNPTGSQFDMSEWGYTEHTMRTPRLECGTAGCAWGTAALSGEFAGEGVEARLSHGNKHNLIATRIEVFYEGYDGFDAAQRFFKLNTVQASWIFGPWAYPAHLRTEAAAELLAATRVLRLIDDSVTEKEMFAANRGDR